MFAIVQPFSASICISLCECTAPCSFLIPSLSRCLFSHPMSSHSLHRSHPLHHSVHYFPPVASPHLRLGSNLPSPPSFCLFPLIPPRPPANFLPVRSLASSFLFVSPLIYLSRWVCTRSDAFPLCLCWMCGIWISYLP